METTSGGPGPECLHLPPNQGIDGGTARARRALPSLPRTVQRRNGTIRHFQLEPRWLKNTLLFGIPVLIVGAQIAAEWAARGVKLHLLDLGGDIAGNGISKLFLTIAAAFAEAALEAAN